ncbi:response regulator transcription factor [Salipaludibacillus sp. LMS25]|jgi:DNA-binding NarL/FixJ family response regulator|uniref:response regulator transcription factor n=1 Tax=Salipaludibacillus sp. LMS25 TaxID=2924031 RepID=UPI0020D04C24|nr:response regulator transcription factor [Salipaludibacillus sp. LMS25]UTR14190.1 response regulator transcription factor [Salipaludibacillus sp. LMS25]
MKLLIGIEHQLLRYGLIQLIKDVHSVTSMVVADSPAELIQSLKKYSFDLIVIDERLPGTGGLRSVLSVLKDQPLHAKKIFMCPGHSDELELKFKDNDIQGIFYEYATLDELMMFFQQVIRGERVVLRMYGHEVKTTGSVSTELTKREEEIFNLKVRGYSVSDTGKLLNISVKTVENHRRNIKKKLNIRKNHEWFEWAKRMGSL